eukprot:TRINITY_DN902_c1_g1_i4.p1 TRINITY_DN902_c1_g1~~TRINITY_DN902_c1_g1_i4.p1  ORF type:complete len:1050 (-),score=224.67 TRINITY_DN902_c1_g1_i4:515-3502(-)
MALQQDPCCGTRPQGGNLGVRVFVSSTFNDMKAERELLSKSVFPQLRAELATRGIALSEVDLRWGVTTDQSQNGDTIRICLSEIDNCDLFVCLLGDRYGWHQDPTLPSDSLLSRTFEKALPDFPWVAQFRARSVTELEVRHAVLNEGARLKDRAMFLFKKPCQEDASNEEQRLLQALKREITASGPNVYVYSDAEEAARTAQDNLRKLLNSAALLQSPRGSSGAQKPVGFSTAVTQLMADVKHNAFRPDPSRAALLVVGEAGSGKTALLTQFYESVARDLPDVLPVACFCGTDGAATAADVMHSIVKQLAQMLELTAPSDMPKDLSSLSFEMLKYLAKAAAQGPVVLIIDGLDFLENTHGEHELRWIPVRLPDTVTMVASARAVTGPAESAGHYSQWRMLPVPRLLEEDYAEMARLYLARYGKSLSPVQSVRLCDGLVRTQATPLFASLLLEELRMFGTFEQLDQCMSHYLSAASVGDLLQLTIQRMESDLDQGDLVTRMLRLLLCSQQGLSESELQLLLHLPPLQLSRLLLTTRPLLAHSPLQPLLLRMAPCMRCAAESISQLRCADTDRCRAELVALFSAAADNPERAAAELPAQLAALHRWQDLARVLADFDMLRVLARDDYRRELLRLWPAAAVEVPHLEEMVLSAIRALPNLRELTVQDCDVITDIGRLFTDLSHYAPAEVAHRWALELGRHLVVNGRVAVPRAYIAAKLENLAYTLREQGRYREAEPLYREAVAMREQSGEGTSATDLAQATNNLAIVLRLQGNYSQAQPLYSRALALRQRALGPRHPDLAQSLNSLACLYQDQGKYGDAEENFSQALRIRSSAYGSYHPETAQSISNLGGLYIVMGRYSEAERLLQQALDIERAIFGEEHVHIAQTLNALGAVMLETCRLSHARSLLSQALRLKEQLLGTAAPEVAVSLNDLAVVYVRQEDLSSALPLYQRALDIRRGALGAAHPDTAQSLCNIAELRGRKGEFDEAARLYNEIRPSN